MLSPELEKFTITLAEAGEYIPLSDLLQSCIFFCALRARLEGVGYDEFRNKLLQIADRTKTLQASFEDTKQ